MMALFHPLAETFRVVEVAASQFADLLVLFEGFEANGSAKDVSRFTLTRESECHLSTER